MESEIYDVVEASYGSLPEDPGFYAAAAATAPALAAKYVEDLGLESENVFSVLED
jgi:hypothetical protein